MLKLFRPKCNAILGVDISSYAVKIIELSGSGDAFCVEGYGYELLPKDAVQGTLINDIDAVAQCIKKVIFKAQLRSKYVVLAVPDSAVMSKLMQIDAGLTEQEIEELVVIEADKSIPYPIDELNLDFEIQGYSAENDSLLDILVVASRAENVSRRVAALAKAGLEVTIVDVESYAVERAAQLLAKTLPELGQGKVIPIVDIGANYTHLFVLNSMKLIFSREEQFGGMQLIDAIAERYTLSRNQAITANAENRLPQDFESAVLRPFNELVVRQVKRSLQFFYSASPHAFVDHVLLAGGLARQLGLAQLIHYELKVPTSIANPFFDMSCKNSRLTKTLNQAAPSLMLACGLALRRGK